MSRLDETISDVGYILDILRAYRNIIRSGSCNECECKKECTFKPDIGQLVRYNCIGFKREDGET